MPRYNPYGNRNQQSEMSDVGDVPYISYQSENTLPMMAEALKGGQQRYDLAQTAIAKYLEENAAGKFRDPDYANVVGALNKSLEDIQRNVKDKYQGQYGDALGDITQKLGKARGIFHQAQKAYEEEEKYKPLYQKLKTEGKLVTPKGMEDPFTKQSYNPETGQFNDIDYSQMYEKNDYNKWIGENISNRLNQNVTDNISSAIANASSGESPFMIAQKVKGTSQNKIAEQISDKDVDLFLSQNPTYAMEFEGDKNAAKQFMVETAKNQVFQQIDQQVINNPYWKEKQKAEVDDPSNLFQTVDDLSKKEREITKTSGYTFDANGQLLIPAKAEPLTSSGIQFGTPSIAEYIDPDYVPSQKQQNAEISDYAKKLGEFRKNHSIPTVVADKKVSDMYQKLQNYGRETIGTLVTLPETTKYSKKNVVGMFVNENGFIAPNQDIYMNGKRIDDADKTKYLKKKLGFSTEKEVADQMKKFHENAYIDFSGDSGPTALVGFVSNSKGETVRIELPSSKEMQVVGKDIHSIASAIKNGKSNKINLANKVKIPNSNVTVSKVKIKYNFDENDNPNPTIEYFDEKDNPVFQETNVAAFTSFLMENAKLVLASFMEKK